ncbi:MAG: oligosaccharide flippase family protein, partial [Oscillospiraceae bacterium]|nr:oligosaccharide flippase family protein [Oscillospiraceae bacterium]
MGRIGSFQKRDIVMKAAVLYALAGILQRGTTFLSGPIFTRLLTREDYGLLMLFNTWYELIGILAMLSLSTGVYNNGLLDFRAARDRFSASLLLVSNLATVLVALPIVIFYGDLHRLIGLPPELTAAMLISFFFSPAFLFEIARRRYEYQYASACIATLVSSVLSVAVAIVAVLRVDLAARLFARVWAEKLTLLAFWIFFYGLILKRVRFRATTAYWGYALRFQLPILPNYLANYLLMGMDRIMIAQMVGAAEAAVYSVAMAAAFLLQILWQSINSSLLPLTYESLRSGDTNELNACVLPFLTGYAAWCA